MGKASQAPSTPWPWLGTLGQVQPPRPLSPGSSAILWTPAGSLGEPGEGTRDPGHRAGDEDSEIIFCPFWDSFFLKVLKDMCIKIHPERTNADEQKCLNTSNIGENSLTPDYSPTVSPPSTWTQRSHGTRIQCRLLSLNNKTADICRSLTASKGICCFHFAGREDEVQEASVPSPSV